MLKYYNKSLGFSFRPFFGFFRLRYHFSKSFFTKRSSFFENSGNYSESFRTSFSKKDGCSDFEVLWSIHESEFDKTFVLISHYVFAHLKNLGTLTNYTTMNDSLIVWFNCCCVVKNYNFGLKIINRLRIDRFIKKNHSLSESSSL